MPSSLTKKMRERNQVKKIRKEKESSEWILQKYKKKKKKVREPYEQLHARKLDVPDKMDLCLETYSPPNVN